MKMGRWNFKTKVIMKIKKQQEKLKKLKDNVSLELKPWKNL